MSIMGVCIQELVAVRGYKLHGLFLLFPALARVYQDASKLGANCPFILSASACEQQS